MESANAIEATTVEQPRAQEEIVALPAGQTALGAIADQVWGDVVNKMLTDPRRPGL